MLKCRQCGQENPAQAKYCFACGLPLVQAAEKAELRRISVLFADVVGSTALVASRPAEEGSVIMAGAAELMSAVIRRFGGTVAREFGDCVLALFGHPEPYEDHALRACQAALALRSEFELGRHSRGAPIRLRIGVHAGEVLLRTVVTDLRRELTADGATTHIAAKVQQSAFPGEVRITRDVLRVVRGQVEIGPLCRR